MKSSVTSIQPDASRLLSQSFPTNDPRHGRVANPGQADTAAAWSGTHLLSMLIDVDCHLMTAAELLPDLLLLCSKVEVHLEVIVAQLLQLAEL